MGGDIGESHAINPGYLSFSSSKKTGDPDQRDRSSDSTCQLKFADHHGCLAHAAGVRYDALELEGIIRQLRDPPVKRGAQPPPEVT